MNKPVTYRDAGVNLEAGDEATRRIKSLVGKTRFPGVLSEIGLFGGLFDLSVLPEKEPVMVSSIDGVGTKTKIAVAMNRFNTIGHDIVNHCTNDILVQGARPLFFLDYIGTSQLNPDQIADIVQGLTEACSANGCALLGGETAEMPGVYETGEVDLVGCIVGVVNKPQILDGSRIQPGDCLIALSSSGLHTNGYSLARKLLMDDLNLTPPGWQQTIGDALLQPHRSYLPSTSTLLQQGLVHGMAHITGGGIPGNLKRIIPAGLVAQVDSSTWQIPPLFELLAERSNASMTDLYQTFNMGVGMILCIPSEQSANVLDILAQEGEQAWRLGEIAAADDNKQVRVQIK